MTAPLVLSIFPGIGLLDRAFEAEGYCVVRGPDPIWGGDVRDFYPPPGVFDGVIGGDPCQSSSPLANMLRAKGLEPTFGDLSGEYSRVVEEASPAWFLRENVPQAPQVRPRGYAVCHFEFDVAWLGCEQSRRRQFAFGVRGTAVDLRKWLEVAVFAGGTKQAVTGRHAGEIGLTGGHRGSPAHYTLDEMLRLQGLPENYLDHCPFTVQGKRKTIANGVPIPMGRALARAVREATA